mmetsp:Transcript_10852/g.16587  ORF Transcript_10852/g.16587 Transcript_10852/m.16587 type:complete len:498 (+) Transcript_10852:88-1581(+)
MRILMITMLTAVTCRRVAAFSFRQRGAITTTTAFSTTTSNSNTNDNDDDNDKSNKNNNHSSAASTISGVSDQAQQMASRISQETSRAISNLLPTATLAKLTTRKYTLPDRTVASQVLMYRQLLHTACKPGLRLSRPYQETPAQIAVVHMPWWEQGIEQSRKMVISYDNLIVRCWLSGAIMPFVPSESESTIETLVDSQGLPPVPHDYWVDRLGFQQPDPVTDFRSAGVLSLAMLVHMVESCPHVHRRFLQGGDASVLPFGITCINVTDMLAKFLMLSKSVDRMDALLSSKPFWRLFGDPNALLAVQELGMEFICDCVVELRRERKLPGAKEKDQANNHNASSMMNNDTGDVTVFDFPQILERAERRLRDDLLGAGPTTVEELRSMAGRLRIKYLKALERKENAVPAKEKIQANKERALKLRDSMVTTAGGLLEKLRKPKGTTNTTSSGNITTTTTTNQDLLATPNPPTPPPKEPVVDVAEKPKPLVFSIDDDDEDDL